MDIVAIIAVKEGACVRVVLVSGTDGMGSLWYVASTTEASLRIDAVGGALAGVAWAWGGFAYISCLWKDGKGGREFFENACGAVPLDIVAIGWIWWAWWG